VGALHRSRFADLHRIQQPTLVVNGVRDEMIPVRNSYWLSEKLPNAVLLTSHGSSSGPIVLVGHSFGGMTITSAASGNPT
jgi:pimeloyl-ACP methyl ester carboxylesterase